MQTSGTLCIDDAPRGTNTRLPVLAFLTRAVRIYIHLIAVFPALRLITGQLLAENAQCLLLDFVAISEPGMLCSASGHATLDVHAWQGSCTYRPADVVGCAAVMVLELSISFGNVVIILGL